MTTPTPGALRAARKIAQRYELGEDRGFLEAVAAIIDSETGLPELVEALAQMVDEGECYCTDHVATPGPCGHCKARAALAKAKAEK